MDKEELKKSIQENLFKYWQDNIQTSIESNVPAEAFFTHWYCFGRKQVVDSLVAD